MRKKSIQQALLAFNDGRPCMCVSDLARALHISRDKARTILAGLDYIPQGRRRDYLISDIAEQLCKRSRT